MLFLLLCLQTLSISLVNSRSRFREDFSLHATLAFSIFFISGLISPFTKINIWEIPEIFYVSLFSDQVYEPERTFSDAIIFFTSAACLYLILERFHDKWRGRKSTKQYKSEQNSDYYTFLFEGITELKSRYLEPEKSELRPYQDSKDDIDLEATDKRLLSWEERSKELIRLSSSSYTFDPKRSWHDRANCWVGENRDNNHLVFIYPAQGEVSSAQIASVEKYAEQIQAKYQKPTGEIIFAFQDDGVRDRSWSGHTNLVQLKTEKELLESLVDFTDYRKEIERRVRLDSLPDVTDINLTIDDVYVDPNFCFHKTSDESSECLENYLEKWLQESGLKQISILGDYGQGKSTAMLMLTYHLLSKQIGLSGRIPILIELRGLAPKSLTPLKLLGAWTSQYRIDAQALLQLHYAGKLLLIFEGFDEMAMVGNQEIRLSHFSRLWQFLHPKAKIIITGRPNFFLDEDEQQKALGIYRPQGNNYYSEVLKLQPFSLGQIEKALRNYKPHVKKQVVNLAIGNSRFRELVSRPSLLNIVADLWDKENLSEKIETLNSASVMKLFVDRSYRRQGVKEGDNRRFMALNSSERDYFMQGVAAFMAVNGDNNQISAEDLNSVADKLIAAIPDSVSEQAVLLGEENRFLRQRLTDAEDVEDVRTDIRACALLVDDPAAPSTFKFGHKSFMEFLFAWTISEYLKTSNGSEASRAILDATDAKLSTLLNLPVAIQFLAELLYVDQYSNEQRRIWHGNSSHPDRTEKAISYSLLKNLIMRKNPRNDSSSSHISTFPIFILISLIAIKDSVYRFITKKYKTYEVIDQINTDTPNIEVSNNYESTLVSNLMSALITPVFIPVIFGVMLLVMPVFLFGYSVMSVLCYISGMRRDPADLITRLSIWNSICKELKINDEVLHEISGSINVPWLRAQPFDYFL
jgi:hypothetical protein